MKRLVLVLLYFALAPPAIPPTFAQEGQVLTVDRQVRGKSDTNINAGIFTTVRQDCTAGPLPVVRLVIPPTRRKLATKQGRLRVTNLRQRRRLEVPAFIAIYRSAKDFSGQDTFTIEVTGSGGQVQMQRVTVMVLGGTGGQGI